MLPENPSYAVPEALVAILNQTRMNMTQVSSAAFVQQKFSNPTHRRASGVSWSDSCLLLRAAETRRQQLRREAHVTRRSSMSVLCALHE